MEVVKEMPPAREILVEFLEAAFNGKANDIPLSDVWKVNEITIGSHEAAETGRVVRLWVGSGEVSP